MDSLIFMISTIVGLICGLVLVFYLIKLIKANIERMNAIDSHDKVRRLIRLLDDAIKLSVISVNQNLIDKLKAEADYYQAEKEEAFVETRDKILKMMKNSSLKSIYPYIDNMDEFINSRIQYYMYIEENNKKS
ncbi:MAG: hypothetical protein N3B21_12010 [Clostridia bacterium]|nr:hypothetical protein [Clostridia bacterium]